jgi:hypothetical protein
MAVFECPFCYEILEVEPPDKLHTAFSSVKPIPNSYYGDIVKKKYKCQNQNCKKSITAFWYAPLEYFSRI